MLPKPTPGDLFMSEKNQPIANEERRVNDRVPLEGPVTVSFVEQEVIGPGENVSDEGVFFIAEAALKVRVRVDDTAEWRDAEIVRVQSMGDGRLGMAARFV